MPRQKSEGSVVALDSMDTPPESVMATALWEDVSSRSILGKVWVNKKGVAYAVIQNTAGLLKTLEKEGYTVDTTRYVPPKKASYELSFSPEFWGDAYTWTSPRKDRASNVADAIHLLYDKDKESFLDMLENALNYPEDALKLVERDGLNEMVVGDVLEKIEKTNTCGKLSVPVDVYIDPEGFYTLDVWDDKEGHMDTAHAKPTGKEAQMHEDNEEHLLDLDAMDEIVNAVKPGEELGLWPSMLEMLSWYWEGQSDPLYAFVSRALTRHNHSEPTVVSEEELARIKETIAELYKDLEGEEPQEKEGQAENLDTHTEVREKTADEEPIEDHEWWQEAVAASEKATNMSPDAPGYVEAHLDAAALWANIKESYEIAENDHGECTAAAYMRKHERLAEAGRLWQAMSRNPKTAATMLTENEKTLADVVMGTMTGTPPTSKDAVYAIVSNMAASITGYTADEIGHVASYIWESFAQSPNRPALEDIDVEDLLSGFKGKKKTAAFPNLFSSDTKNWIRLQTAVMASRRGSPATPEQAKAYVADAAKEIIKQLTAAVPEEVQKVITENEEKIYDDLLAGVDKEELMNAAPAAPVAPVQQQMAPMPASLRKAFAARN